MPTEAEAFEELVLDGSDDDEDNNDDDVDKEDRLQRYLPDKHGIVYEHVDLEMDEETDRVHGSRKCPCRCHADPEAPKVFQDRLRHCIPCAKVIVNGR